MDESLKAAIKGPFFKGGPRRNVEKMIVASANMTDVGGLPPPGALMLTQLLLNLAGHAGRREAQDLISAFFDAADVPYTSPQQPD